MATVLFEDFIQPEEGAIAQIVVGADEDWGLGKILVIGSPLKGRYAAIKYLNTFSGSLSLTVVRLKRLDGTEVSPGTPINRGSYVRSLTTGESLTLSHTLQAQPRRARPLTFLTQALGSLDTLTPYGRDFIPRRRTFYSVNDDEHWQTECDREIRKLISRFEPPDNYRGSFGDLMVQLRETAKQALNLSYFELHQSLRVSEPAIEYLPYRTPTTEGYEALLVFRRGLYRITPVEGYRSGDNFGSLPALGWYPGGSMWMTSSVIPTSGYGPVAMPVDTWRASDYYDTIIDRIRGNTTPPPVGCKGCKHLHGKTYNGNLLVCGMYPSGYEGEGGCPDKESLTIDGLRRDFGDGE